MGLQGPVGEGRLPTSRLIFGEKRGKSSQLCGNLYGSDEWLFVTGSICGQGRSNPWTAASWWGDELMNKGSARGWVRGSGEAQNVNEENNLKSQQRESVSRGLKIKRFKIVPR